MPAPVASGWSGCRVGLAPTGKRRLVTAHVESGRQSLLSDAVLSRYVTAACWTGLSNQDHPQIHEAPRDGISGFGGGGRSKSTSRIPSSEIQAISQNASM